MRLRETNKELSCRYMADTHSGGIDVLYVPETNAAAIAIAIAIATALLCVWLVSLRFSALGSFGFGTPGFFAQTCAAPQALPRPLQQRQVRQYGKKRLGCTWLGGGEYEWAGHKKFKLKMFYAWANHNKARKCHFLLTKRIL